MLHREVEHELGEKDNQEAAGIEKHPHDELGEADEEETLTRVPTQKHPMLILASALLQVVQVAQPPRFPDFPNQDALTYTLDLKVDLDEPRLTGTVEYRIRAVADLEVVRFHAKRSEILNGAAGAARPSVSVHAARDIGNSQRLVNLERRYVIIELFELVNPVAERFQKLSARVGHLRRLRHEQRSFQIEFYVLNR